MPRHAADRRTLSYEQAGVDYDLIDPLKVAAQRAAAATAAHLAGARLQRSAQPRAANRPTWSTSGPFYLASIVECLGSQGAGGRRDGRAHRPQLLRRHRAGHHRDGRQRPDHRRRHAAGGAGLLGRRRLATGSATPQRAQALVAGWKRACDVCGVAWGGGETPALAGIVEAGRIDLAASCTGLVNPKQRLSLGDQLAPGDAIVLLASSGIHANGLSLARKLVERLPQGYLTPRSTPGSSYGEALLAPTRAVFAGHRGAVAAPASRRTTAPTSPATAGASCCATQARCTYRIHTRARRCRRCCSSSSSMPATTTARPTARSTWAPASRCSSPPRTPQRTVEVARSAGRRRAGSPARSRPAPKQLLIEPLGMRLRRRRAAAALNAQSNARVNPPCQS